MNRDSAIIIGSLVIIAFVLRMGSFAKEHTLTYDESVYPRLAVQVIKDSSNYNTLELYQEELKRGRHLPLYFKKPLFKHPPFFTYLVAGSMRIFGRTMSSAFKVSLFFGILLIPLAYLLGTALFDDRVGIYAAFLMTIEPIGWICSQKIWMETTLAFFVVLSFYFFVLYLRRSKSLFMIASGVAAGCAVLAKYPGILVVAGIFTYALLCDRSLFRKRAFIIGLLAPFLMAIPWVSWNLKVYGVNMFSVILTSGNMVILVNNIRRFWWAFFILAGVAFSLAVLWRKYSAYLAKIVEARNGIFLKTFMFVIFGVIAFVFKGYIVNAWNITHIAKAGWRMGLFNNEPWGFFPWKIIILSPMYLFSYTAIVISAYDKEHMREYLLVLFYSLFLYIFYILWGGFQCRYVLALTAPFMVLSARVQLFILDKIKQTFSGHWSRIAYALLIMVFAYAAIKTLQTDYSLAIPNNTCYF